MAHPKTSIVFGMSVDAERDTITEVLDAAVGAGSITGYETVNVIDAPDTVTLYVVAYPVNVMELLRRADDEGISHYIL